MQLYIQEVPDPVTYGLYSLSVVLAAWRGRVEERVLAAFIAWQALNGFLPGAEWTHGWPTDLVTFAACIALVLYGGRYWTIWAAAAALLGLVTDVLRVMPGLSSWSYASAKLVWSYVMTAALIYGAWTARRAVTSPSAPSGP